MKGITPPWDMMTLLRSLLSSSSLRIASCKWRGTILQRRHANGVSTAANIHLPPRNSDSPLLLIVPRSIPRELKDLSGEILEDSGEIHRCAGTDSFSVLTILQKTVQTSDGERKSCAGGTGLGFGRVAIASAIAGGAGVACFSCFSFSGLCTSTKTISTARQER